MHIAEIWQLLKEEFLATHALEWIAIVLAVAEVLLARVNSIWLYPTGIGSTVIFIYLLFQSQLYADSFLNLYYLVMSIYGWWNWYRKKGEPALPVSWCNAREWGIVAAIVVGGFFFLWAMLLYTPSTVPVSDAWVSATAWAGMWLLARRKIENWVLLNISNLFAIPLYFYKQLPLFGLLTIFLFFVAVFGFFDWKREYRKEAAL